jgi:ubiquinone/menaquinone biosynthesis C-methylase UbiE
MSRLIRHDDFFLFLEKARSVGLRKLLGRILGTGRKKVEESWEHITSERSNWWDLEGVAKRWNRLISGDAEVTYQDYVAKKYLHRRKGLRAVSIGCGTGGKEIIWAETKRFRSIQGFDISRPRIEFARELVRKSTFNNQLRFEVGNVHDLDLQPASFDVVIFDNSLHHCSPLAQVIERVDRWLTEDGILIANEYVGPSRFQWTDDQVTITNALLQMLPAHLRRRKDGRRKERMSRPGSLAVRINDPSEAAESHLILSLLEQRFETLELRPYGGTILANLLKDIAHNFMDDIQGARDWLNFVFDVEDRLIELKRIPSDYVFGVFRKRNRKKSEIVNERASLKSST